MNQKFRTTIKLPKPVRQAMLSRIIEEGYGLRGKSRWIMEAIESLFEMKHYYEFVEIANEMTELTETEVVQLSTSIKKQIDETIIKVRQHYPALEGVQSGIIRASIIQRLLRS